MRFRRIAHTVAIQALIISALLFSGLAPLASAADILATEEVTEEAPVETGPSGAFIDAPAPDDDSVTPAWTYRFLVPTALLLVALVIIGTVIAYFVRVVRARYVVVE